MAVRTKEELLNDIKSIIGDSTDDTSIILLEDISDTFDELESRSAEDWKTKYEENDAEWRRKYTDRFFSTMSFYIRYCRRDKGKIRNPSSKAISG